MEQNKFYQIKNVTEHEYTLVGCNGRVTTLPIQEVDKIASAFTIEDAKDGDVLVTKEDKRPFIFKSLLDPNHPNFPVAYCGINSDNLFFISMGVRWWTDEDVCPATKEQRDLLFTRMKEAGYDWDSEKKELKKIELKPTWSKEDERMMIFCCDYLDDNQKSWLLSLKERYTWDPEK